MTVPCCARRKKTSKTWVSNLSSLPRGNRGYGSEDSGAAKSNDKPSNELRKTAISTTFATSSRSCNSVVHAHYVKKKIPRENRIWDTIPGCQKCRNNSSETRISKCVTNMVRHHDQYEREEDGAMHVNIIYSQYWKKDFKFSDIRNSRSRIRSIAFIVDASRRDLKSVKMKMDDWNFFVQSRDIQVDSLFTKTDELRDDSLHMERIHLSRGSSTRLIL